MNTARRYHNQRSKSYEEYGLKFRWFITFLIILSGIFLLLLGLGIINFPNSTFYYGKKIIILASLPFLLMGLFLVIKNIFKDKFKFLSTLLMSLFYFSILIPFHIVFYNSVKNVGWRVIYLDFALTLIILIFDFVMGIVFLNFIYKLITGKGFLIDVNPNEFKSKLKSS